MSISLLGMAMNIISVCASVFNLGDGEQLITLAWNYCVDICSVASHHRSTYVSYRDRGAIRILAKILDSHLHFISNSFRYFDWSKETNSRIIGDGGGNMLCWVLGFGSSEQYRREKI